MKVFKFGGASVKDAAGVKNVAKILSKYKEDEPLVVISAMGKMTNALEEVARAFYLKQDDVSDKLNFVKEFHSKFLKELFEEGHPVFDAVSNLLVEIEWALDSEPRPDYPFEYDQIVSVGELLSTTIVSAYLKEIGIDNDWLDARDVIKTDNKHQSAVINWDLTTACIKEKVNTDRLTITQGFIGCTSENFTTTLGREGSDYSAAIFATVLGAKKLVIWKDVIGVLHADPRYFDDAKKVEKLSFQEAIELAFYGASVIHPKTLQPLKRNRIPLQVRSFIDLEQKGTWVAEDEVTYPDTAFYILKKNQTLLSISARDLDFIVENHLSSAFLILAKYNAKVNLVQNSAVSCYFALDVDDLQIDALVEELSKHFKVKYNSGLDLLTVRHYHDEDVDLLLNDKEVLLTQKNRTTIQVLYK
ncbi:MAG: aspartate kinase [Flavobacteriales bacterium]|nr:aspartate kinase [Flavobacteriales bacterium]